MEKRSLRRIIASTWTSTGNFIRFSKIRSVKWAGLEMIPSSALYNVSER